MRMKSTSLPMLGAWLALSIVACRGAYHDPGVEGPGSDGGPRVYRVQEVQSDTMPAGAAVEVHGAVVTAIDSFGNRVGDFWIQDPDGGPYSGVHVFGAPLSQVADLSPGDVVAIVGAIKSEFAISGDASRRSVTELQAPMGG